MYEYSTDVQKIVTQAKQLRNEEIARLFTLAVTKISNAWKKAVRFNNQWVDSLNAVGDNLHINRYERYLNRSVDVFDLERRQRELDRHRSNSYLFG
jgi:hypothetical protein